MREVLHKFPPTPHLAWLGQAIVRDDKVLAPTEVRSFLSGPVVLEEKVDGANLGLSFGQTGAWRFQNRGHWLEGKLTNQWEPLRGWAATHEAAIRAALPENHILFGEWCYLKHSIFYDRLPDWFLVFDVYDCGAKRFWSTKRRDALAAEAHLATVPGISTRDVSLNDLRTILDGSSDLYDGPREGIYLRRDNADWLLSRAKLVQPGFTQAISEHWTRRGLVENRLCAAAATPA